MAFQELPDLDCVKTYALGGTDKKSNKKNPTTITGYYVGTRQVDSPKSKTGVANLHVFQTKEGNHGVWGKTNLDSKMKAARPGLLTQVEFTGMMETKNNPMYKYRVKQDLNDFIDVATLSENSASGTEPEYEATGNAESYDEPEAELGDEERALDEALVTRAAPPARAATAPDATRQRKVQDLLNGRRKATA